MICDTQDPPSNNYDLNKFITGPSYAKNHYCDTDNCIFDNCIFDQLTGGAEKCNYFCYLKHLFSLNTCCVHFVKAARFCYSVNVSKYYDGTSNVLFTDGRISPCMHFVKGTRSAKRAEMSARSDYHTLNLDCITNTVKHINMLRYITKPRCVHLMKGSNFSVSKGIPSRHCDHDISTHFYFCNKIYTKTCNVSFSELPQPGAQILKNKSKYSQNGTYITKTSPYPNPIRNKDKKHDDSFDYYVDSSIKLNNRFDALSGLDSNTHDTLPPDVTRVRSTSNGALPPGVTTVHSNSLHPTRPTSSKTMNNQNTIRLGHVNARSSRNKALILYDQIIDQNLDIFFISESWLIDGNVDDDKVVNTIKPAGFDYTSCNRNDRQGGSVCAYYKSNLKFKQLDAPKVNLDTEGPTSIKTMEIMETRLTVKDKLVRLVCIYRPDSSKVKRYAMSQFYDEFSELMTHYNLCNDEIVIFGDLNFHVNKPQKPDVKKFLDILECNNLCQHITEPTHELGNTLDLVITRQGSNLVHNIQVGDRISDHDCITWGLNLQKPEKLRKTIRMRKTKQIDMNAFKSDLNESLQSTSNCNNLSELIDTYNLTLRNTLDKHAPESSKEIIVRDPTPWMSNDISIEKRKRRKLEKKMKRTRLEVDKEAFKKQKNKVNDLLNEKKSDFYKQLVTENKENPRNLFRVINAALHRKQDTPLPPHTSKTELANEFGDFFTDKIDNIRNYLDTEAVSKNTSFLPECRKYTEPLLEFKTLSEDEVRELVKASPTKHCELDPMPTWLVKARLISVQVAL